MRVAIIGTGNVGKALGSSLVRAGHTVVYAAQAARQLEALAWLNISMQLRFGGDWRTAFVLVGAPAAAAA